MKIIKIVLFLSCFMISCNIISQEAEIKKEYYSNGELKNIGFVTPDSNLKIGEWEYYYDNGQIRTTGFYDLDVKIGEWKTYYKDGTLMVLENYADFTMLSPTTKRHGIWKSYYPNSQLESIGHYQSSLLGVGEKDGEWKHYYENGQLASISYYEEDGVGETKKVGTWKSFSISGNLELEVTYGEDESRQYVKKYNDNGELISSGNYKDGELVGVWNIYENNEMISTIDYDMKYAGKHINNQEYEESSKYLVRAAMRGVSEAQFNLGVLIEDGRISSGGDKYENAKSWYKKSCENNFTNACTNLAALILKDDALIVNQMNSLGNSKEDDIIFDRLNEKRNGIYRNALIYLKKAYKLNPENNDVKTTIDNINNVLGL